MRKILGPTVENFVVTATWHTGFMHPCYTNHSAYLNQVYYQERCILRTAFPFHLK